MYETYDLGDRVQVKAVFTNAETEGAVDPDVVNVSIRSPDGEVTTLVYLDDADVVRTGAGIYTLSIDANQAGTWYYRWWSTGAGQAAEERRFVVRDAQAVEA